MFQTHSITYIGDVTLKQIKMKAGSFLAIVLINLISFSIFSDAKVIARDVNPDFVQTGEASWYGPGFHGRKTANGERFDTYEMTAAHKTLPFNTLVKVTNLNNDLTVIVRINDRGPFIKGRIIDLSKAAKEEIEMGGLASVRLEIYDPEEDEKSEEADEKLVPINLFEEEIPSTSKIFVELDPLVAPEGDLSDEQLSAIFSGPKIKLKVLTPDVADANLNIYEEVNGSSQSNYFDITGRTKFITGYSIEIAKFEDQSKCDKLTELLESEGFKNIFIEEMKNGSLITWKLLVGNYADHSEAKEDIIRVLKIDPTFTTNIVKIGG